MGQSLTSRSTAEIILETVILGAVELFAFVGNLLVIISSLRNRNLRTTTNLYIKGLALSDLLAACITMPMTLVTIVTGDWNFGTAGTYIQGFFCPFFDVRLHAHHGSYCNQQVFSHCTTRHLQTYFYASKVACFCGCCMGGRLLFRF